MPGVDEVRCFPTASKRFREGQPRFLRASVYGGAGGSHRRKRGDCIDLESAIALSKAGIVESTSSQAQYSKESSSCLSKSMLSAPSASFRQQPAFRGQPPEMGCGAARPCQPAATAERSATILRFGRSLVLLLLMQFGWQAQAQEARVDLVAGAPAVRRSPEIAFSARRCSSARWNKPR